MDKTTEEMLKQLETRIEERPTDDLLRSVYEYAKRIEDPFTAVLDGLMETRIQNEIYIRMLDRMRAGSG
jgi:hypothetical protein